MVHVEQPSNGASFGAVVGDAGRLYQAWDQVRSGRGAAGVDGATADNFGARESRQLGRLAQQLVAGTYQPPPGALPRLRAP